MRDWKTAGGDSYFDSYKGSYPNYEGLKGAILLSLRILDICSYPNYEGLKVNNK